MDLDESGATIVVSFRFDRALKDFVKSLPGTRFDWTTKTWQAPVERVATLVPSLRERGFRIAADVEALAEEQGAPAGEEGPGVDTYAVGDLNRAVARAVGDRFPTPVWVAGVLQNWDKNRPEGHAYFKLAEVDAAGRVTAAVDAVLFRNARQRVEQAMRRAGLELTDGLSARFIGRVEVYEVRGSYQLVVEDIDATWSAGELALRREEVLAELRQRGLMERQVERRVPLLPLRLALLTSASSDAYHDFASSLRASGYPFAVTLFDVRVQGPDLSSTVRAALARVRAWSPGFDLVVITRGGGSRVELAGWDDLGVAVDVAELPTKVLVAIGHQQDRSVLDEIAWSAKTPTEAGAAVVSLVAECGEITDRAAERLARGSERALEAAYRRLVDGGRSLALAARHAMSGARARVEREYPGRVARAARERVHAERARLHRAEGRLRPERVVRATSVRRSELALVEARLAGAARAEVRRGRSRMTAAVERLERSGPREVRDWQRRVDGLDARLRLCDPRRILGRGFAIVRDADGVLVRSVRSVAASAPLTVEVEDGVFGVQVGDDHGGGRDD